MKAPLFRELLDVVRWEVETQLLPHHEAASRVCEYVCSALPCCATSIWLVDGRSPAIAARLAGHQLYMGPTLGPRSIDAAHLQDLVARCRSEGGAWLSGEAAPAGGPLARLTTTAEPPLSVLVVLISSNGRPIGFLICEWRSHVDGKQGLLRRARSTANDISLAIARSRQARLTIDTAVDLDNCLSACA